MRALGRFALLLWSFSASAEEGLKQRSDLGVLERTLCQAKHIPSSLETMAQGVTDAQIAGLFLRGPAWKLHMLERVWLKKRPPGYHGGSFGTCGKQSKTAWLLYTRSPAPLLHRNSALVLPAELAQKCRKIAAHSVDPRGGNANNLEVFQGRIQLPHHEAMVSVACLPNDPELGYQTWFLVPTSRAVLRHPLPLELKTGPDARTMLTTWIQGIRKHAKLKPLSPISGLSAAPKFTLEHQKVELSSVASLLKRQGLRLRGENLAQGQNLQEIVWLLWMSPQHRDLLSDAKAEFLQVFLESYKNRSYARILTAQKQVEKNLSVAED